MFKGYGAKVGLGNMRVKAENRMLTDFNVSDQSEAYQTITGNSFVLKDAHKIALQQEGASYTFHDFGRIPADSCEKIDFIFVTPQIEVQCSYIPEENREAKKFLSDHNPEIVHLSF